MLRLAVGCGLAAVVAGHGALVFPRSRNAVDWQEVGCDASTDSCASSAKGNGCVNTTHPGEPCHNGQVRARVRHFASPSHHHPDKLLSPLVANRPRSGTRRAASSGELGTLCRFPLPCQSACR